MKDNEGKILIRMTNVRNFFSYVVFFPLLSVLNETVRVYTYPPYLQ